MEHILLISMLIYIVAIGTSHTNNCGVQSTNQVAVRCQLKPNRNIYLCKRFIYYRAIFSAFYLWSKFPSVGFFLSFLVFLLDFGPVMFQMNRNRVDCASQRTINIFAINFLILSVWSPNGVFYDILRLRNRDIVAQRHIISSICASVCVCLCVSVSKWTGTLLYKFQ